MDATAYLITNVTVIDGTGGEPLGGGAVVVADERITWVGPATLAPAFEPRGILDGTIREGDTVEIDAPNGKLVMETMK